MRGHGPSTRSTPRRLCPRAPARLPWRPQYRRISALRILAMTAVAKPLKAVKGATDLSGYGDLAEWDGKKSVRTFHIFVNETTEPVDLFWFYEKQEQYHATINPDSNAYVGTYTFNQWKVKSKTGQMLAVHAGQSATVIVKPAGCVIQFNTATADADQQSTQSMQTPKGTFSVRGNVLGMPVWAFECVPDRAVDRAKHVIQNMLQGLPADIMQAMMSHKPSLAVFGRNHVVSDVPAHAFMKHSVERDLDTSSRGLGGTPTVPWTSCSEENLTMENDWLYPCQSILVHEMGHAVQNLGMDLALKERVQAAYTAALLDKLYPDDCYMMTNDHEYWATGTEAWFESNIRVDVNGGVNSRETARAIDPRLAALLAEVYGDGQWRFHHDCPKPLSFERGKPPSATPATVTAQQPAATAAGTVSTAAATATAASQQLAASTRPSQPSTSATAPSVPITTTTATTTLRTATTSHTSNDPALATRISSTHIASTSTQSQHRQDTGPAAAGSSGPPAQPPRRVRRAGSRHAHHTSGGSGHTHHTSLGPLQPLLQPPGSMPGPSHAALSSPDPSGTSASGDLDSERSVSTLRSQSPPSESTGGPPQQGQQDTQGEQGWGAGGGCQAWPMALNVFCPGTLVYPAPAAAAAAQRPPRIAGSRRTHAAATAAPHNSEVIAILSGGALTGGQQELARTLPEEETEPLAITTGFSVFTPFAYCLQGRQKKLKK